MYFYILKMQQTDYCKYGITEDLKERMYHYRSHNPLAMEILYLKKNLTYPFAKELEGFLYFNDFLADKQIDGRKEWLELNESEIKKIIGELEIYIREFNGNKYLQRKYDV